MDKKLTFKLTALSAALGMACAQAQTADNSQVIQLDQINVQSNFVSARPIEDWRALEKDTSTDLKTALRDQVGIQFGGGNGASQWVTIRGMGQDQIDYVVDDTSSSSQIFHHQGRFSLDPALVKVVAIEKGTGSASAGFGATNGRIEARTVDAADLLLEGKDVGVRISGGVNSNEGANTGLAVYGRANGFDGIVIGNWVKEKNYEDGNGNKAPHNALGNRSFLAKGAYRINENNRIELSHRREEQYGTRALREEFSTSSNNAPNHRHRITDTTNLSYAGRQLGVLGSLDANVFHITSEQKNKSINPRPDTRDNALDGIAKIETTGANLGFTTPIPNTKHLVKYGLNWRTESVNKTGGAAKINPNVTHAHEKEDIGAYVEGIWSFAPVTLTTGLRYDYFNFSGTTGDKSSDGAFSPSAGIIWDVNKNFSLNASYNVATRSPRLREASFAAGDIRVADGLKAERSRNAEIGFNWEYEGLSLEGAYFYQTIKDLQSFKRIGTGENAYSEVVSSGKLKNKGYELNAAYRWEGLTARLGVADNDPKMNGTTADSVMTAIPLGRQWMTGLSYQFDNPKLEIGWRGRYAEGTEYMGTKRGTRNPELKARPGYGVHDVYLNWQPLGKDHFNVNFAVNNVGDKYYVSHSQRANSTFAEQGRDFRLSFNYRF